MENMNITNAKYYRSDFTNENVSINCQIDGEHHCVPLDPANRHYAEIMRQVEDGSLVISPAEGEQ